MTEIGDCFRTGEVWTSPRGKKYKVIEVANIGRHNKPVATLKGDTGGKISRSWDAVDGWVRDPEDNK